MAYKKIEKEVIKKACDLDQKMNSLLKTHKGKYAIFDGSKLNYKNSYQSAVNFVGQTYSPNDSVVIRKVSDKTPVLSSLVSL